MATENIQIKFTVDKTQLDGAVASSKTLEAELKKAGVSAQYMDSALEGVDEALKEAGVDAKTFNKALEQSAQSTKTLRTQLAEAKNEAVRMSQQFGAFSKEAQNAAKKAALIKDEIGDLNDTLDALNPDAKLNAFVKLGQGIQGGFQAATGALQLFGVENERITKLAQQFQGVLNLTQGINSVLQLKDVYGQLRLVLGVTTTAQAGLNTTMAAGALAAAPYIVAIGAVLAATYVLTEGFDDEAEAINKLIAEQDKLTAGTLAAARSYLDFIGANEKLYQLMKEQGASELDILNARLKNLSVDLDLLKTAREKANQAEFTAENLELQRELDKQINETIGERAILLQKIANEIQRIYIQSLKDAQAQRELEQAATNSLKNQFESEFQTRLSAADKALSLNKIVNEIQSKTTSERVKNDLNSELIALERKREAYIEFGKDTEEIDALIALNRKKFREEEEKEEIESQEERKKRQIANANFALSVLQETLSVYQTFQQAQYTEELQALEESKRQGAISEERYQEKLRKIKRKAAEEDKKYQIFAATMGAAQAIINALGTTPSSAVIPAVALASILGAANLAKIAATPIPKFKTGTLNVGGGNIDADGGMHAIIHKGEAVIPADRNRDYHPTISALFKRQIKPSDINSFVEMKLKGRMNNTVNAKINARELAGVMPKNDKVELRNSALLARQIGKEIARNNDPRMR
jgi:DNA repair exonuclease SbcCD ATPase subunit